MIAKHVFIIGMRRSGTSVLRELMMKHPDISDIEFEPHPLWNAVDLAHFKRYEDYLGVKLTIQVFKNEGNSDHWHGAKFALNPGVKVMEWVWLPRTFPEAKIIFIIREAASTFASYHSEDKEAFRGCMPRDIYMPFHAFLLEGFRDYFKANVEKSRLVFFESLLKETDQEMKKVWNLLDIKPLEGLDKFIKKPTHRSTP